MNSLDLVQPILRHWRLILVAIIVCVGASVGAIFAQTREYRSHAQLFVSTQGSAAVADAVATAQAGSEFVTARVQSYVDLVSSPKITDPVVAELGLHMTPAELAGELSATAPLNTVLINISVTDQSPARAQRIAQAVARQYVVLINQLESSPHAAAPVRITISNPASFSTAPVSPQKKLDIALGLIIGLLLGIAGALVLERLDETLKSADELSKSFGVSVLATVPFDPSAREGLDALETSRAVGRLEALRTLRTALRYIDVDNPPRCLVVTSCDAGAGKTVTSATLAAVVADGGSNVVVIEGDLRRPRLREFLGVSSTAPKGVAEVLGEGREVDDLVLPVERPSAANAAGTLTLLASGGFVPNPSELLGSNRMREMLVTLRDTYDMVIIDAPPLLPVTDAAVVAGISDGVVFIVEYGRTTHSGLSHALGSLEQVGARVLGAVANKAAAGHGYGYGYGYDYSPERKDEAMLTEEPDAGQSSSEELGAGKAVSVETPDVGEASFVDEPAAQADEQPTAEAPGAEESDAVETK